VQFACGGTGRGKAKHGRTLRVHQNAIAQRKRSVARVRGASNGVGGNKVSIVRRRNREWIEGRLRCGCGCGDVAEDGNGARSEGALHVVRARGDVL
jgi:hypothetical protein